MLFLAQLIGVVYSIPGARESKPFMCDETQGSVWDDLSIGKGEQAEEFEIPVVEFEGFILPEDIQLIRTAGEKPITIAEAMIERRYFADAISPIGHSPSVSPSSYSRLYNVEYPEGSSLAASVEKGNFPDASLLGYRLYSKYNRELVISGLALLAATIGSVVLTRRPKKH